MTLKSFSVALLVALSLSTAVVSHAAGPQPDAARELSAALKEAWADVKAERYEAGIGKLEAIVAGEPGNADALSWLGFANRKLGRFDISYGWYEKALAIDPDHLGANEYLGELYVQTGEMEKAEGQLGKLEKLCPFGCEELDDLKEAIAEARKKGGG
ncbi:MAG: tetratricopeptide repeat protein [Rhodospirillales bacterium]